jgi:hypothetical protein
MITLEARACRATYPRPAPLLWCTAVGIGSLFLGYDSQRSAPFGPSHDGFNASVYLTGGRAILEDGPLESRLGAASRTIGGYRVI